jgi:predicted RNase H-like nuclease (RuvC/YqgF family)
MTDLDAVKSEKLDMETMVSELEEVNTELASRLQELEEANEELKTETRGVHDRLAAFEMDQAVRQTQIMSI